MKYYKLTDANARTHGGCQWGEGITHETDGTGDLCGPGWIHLYTDPVLAVMLNPIHAKFDSATMRLWECEVGGDEKTDRGLKVGRTEVTTTKEIPVPTVTTDQRVRFAILCSLEIYREPSYVSWANDWLSGADRSIEAAEAMAAWAAAEARPLASRAGERLAPETIAKLEALGRERALVYETLVSTGLRWGELRSIRVADCMLDCQTPHLVLRAADEKARRGATVSVPRDLAERLRTHLQGRSLNLGHPGASVVKFRRPMRA